MPNIFREEVLREQELQWLGAVQVVRPSYFAPLVALALLLALILIAFCIFAETSKSTQLNGMLVPREGFSHVSARLNGKVSKVFVTEGQFIDAGEPIAEVSNDRAAKAGLVSTLSRSTLESRKSSLEAEKSLLQAKREALIQAHALRLSALRKEISAAELEYQALRGREAIDQKRVERFSELTRQGFIAETQLQDRQQDLLESQSKISPALRSSASLFREEERLKSELSSELAAVQVALDVGRNRITA